VAVEQRFVFDQVASLYDRARPGYPETLVDEVIARSGIAPGGRILEIGCGTGQATEAFARRGYALTALEPGPAMREVAQARLARHARVEILPHTFESWPLENEAFDLVISAQAFHWVDPEIRLVKAADALRPDGALAIFGHTVVAEISPLARAVDDAYSRHAPALLGMHENRWYADAEAFRRSFAESGRFGPVTRRIHPWSRAYSPSEYVDLMRTHSNHRLLPDTQREALHRAITAAIEAHGGRIEVRYEAHLYLARRL
jgi:SAM-dependent methyltransferase